MHRVVCVLALYCVCTAAWAGSIVFDNGAPNVTSDRTITSFRTADDFVVPAVTLGSLQFWFASTSPITTDPNANFDGSITYAFYNN
jgi:hypothetical protein